MAEKQCNLLKNGGGMIKYPTSTNPTVVVGEYDGKTVYMTRFSGTLSGVQNNTSKTTYLENGFGGTKQLMDVSGFQQLSGGGALSLTYAGNWNSNTLTITLGVGVNTVGLHYSVYSYQGATEINNQDYLIFVTWYYK